MKSIETFLTQNDDWRGIFELPRVAELVDACKQMEAEALEVERENIELRAEMASLLHENLRHQDVDGLRRWYEGLLLQLKRKREGFNQEVDRCVQMRTAGLRSQIAKLHARLQERKGKAA